MNIVLNRTARILEFPKRIGETSVLSIAESCGFKWIHPFDIDNFEELSWEGTEFNRLYEKDGVIYRFNQWTGSQYPFDEIELQEIGFIPERIIAK